MHRDHRADTLVKIVAHRLVTQIHRHERALPVVAVDDVRLVGKLLQKLRHRAAEKAEALAVVIMTVKPIAQKVLLVIDKIPRHTLALDGKKTAVDPPPRKAHIDILLKAQLALPFFLHGLVQRQNDAHAVAVFGKRGRKTARNVRKTAGLAERDRFTCHIQNIHGRLPSSLRSRCPFPQRADNSRARSAFCR